MRLKSWPESQKKHHADDAVTTRNFVEQTPATAFMPEPQSTVKSVGLLKQTRNGSIRARSAV